MELTDLFAFVAGVGGLTTVAVVFIDMMGKRRNPVSAADAEAILAERFARGEIDESEYASRLSTLKLGPPLQIH